MSALWRVAAFAGLAGLVSFGCDATGRANQSPSSDALVGAATDVLAGATPDDAGDGSPTGSKPAQPAIWFSPGDLMSDVATTPIVVGILALPVVDTTTPSLLEGKIGVVSWPELEPVSVTKKIRDERVPGEGHVVEVQVTPTTPLLDRWYAIRVGALPSGLSLRSYARKLSDGSLVVRFRPGSGPVISSIRGCDKGGGKRSVIIMLSENVTAKAGATDLVAVNMMSGGSLAATVPCKLNTDPSAGRVDALQLFCEPFSGTTDVRFALSEELHSQLGVIVKNQAMVFKIADYALTPDCFEFHP